MLAGLQHATCATQQDQSWHPGATGGAATQGKELDILEGCVGWQLEACSAGVDGQRTMSIRLGPFFRLHLAFAPVPDQAPTAHGCLELTHAGMSCP